MIRLQAQNSLFIDWGMTDGIAIKFQKISRRSKIEGYPIPWIRHDIKPNVGDVNPLSSKYLI